MESIETIQTWLQDALHYIEENIIRLPHWRTVRLLLIVAAYYILRPWLLKLAGVSAGFEPEKPAQHNGEKPASSEETREAVTGASREEGEMGEKEEEEIDEKMLRRREDPLKEILEGKDRTGGDGESDREIEDFLRKVIK